MYQLIENWHFVQRSFGLCEFGSRDECEHHQHDKLKIASYLLDRVPKPLKPLLQASGMQALIATYMPILPDTMTCEQFCRCFTCSRSRCYQRGDGTNGECYKCKCEKNINFMEVLSKIGALGDSTTPPANVTGHPNLCESCHN